MTADVQKLKALALAATPGPWVADENWNGEGSSIVDSRGEVVADDGTAGGEYSERLNKRDANFIAAANPATVLELIADRDHMKLERDELRAEVERLRAATPAQSPISEYVVGLAQANAVRGFAQAILECGIVTSAISTVFLDCAEKCAKRIVDAAIEKEKA